MPPADDLHPGVFLVMVVGGSVLLIGIGLSFYWRGKYDLYLQVEQLP